jgi:hypothetical protein
MGTCAVTIKRRQMNLGSVKGVVADVAMSGSYIAGGDTLTIASLGLTTLEQLIMPGTSSILGHTLAPVLGATVKTDPLIFARDVGTGAQVANAVDLSTMVFRVIAIGDYSGG